MELPKFSYAQHPETKEMILIERFSRQYGKLPEGFTADPKGLVHKANELLHVAPIQAAAMFTGSMFGWDAPGADPNSDTYKGRTEEQLKEVYTCVE